MVQQHTVLDPSDVETWTAMPYDELLAVPRADYEKAQLIVSRTADEPVEFARSLNNRIVNLVPVPDITKVPRWVSEETQTVGIYPESLRERLRDDLALHGVQRTQPIQRSVQMDDLPPDQLVRVPHDGTEPYRRSVRWVVDTSAAPA